MFKNYFKTAFKVFARNKTFSAINILGLSIGTSAALIIFLIVQYEFSFDKREQDADRIYRVVMDLKFNGNEGHSGAVPAPLSAAIRQEVPGMEATVPVMQFQGDATAEVSIAGENTSEPAVFKKQPHIIFTNPQYFSLLPFQWLVSSPEASLRNPFNVVLTVSRAKQYFPSRNLNDIIGKEIKYNDDFTATVSGIVNDLDANTSFQASEFISFATIAETHMQKDFMMNVWNDWMAYSAVYVKLGHGINAAVAEKKVDQLLTKYNKNANRDDANSMHFRLQPLADIHFNQDYASFDQRIAHKKTLYGITAIALFLLLLACINYINLTTANAASRAKEIGIRKTMGSSRKQILLQFMGETFLLTITACIISLAIAPLLLRWFAAFIPEGLKYQPFQQGYILLFILLLAVVVSILSGLYPAFILSGYKPVRVLKNLSFTGTGESRYKWVRKTLTVSQFVIAQFFVIGTVMVSKQIDYSMKSDLGFRKDAILSFDIPRRDTVAGRPAALLAELNSIPGVQLASRGFLTPADEGQAYTDIKYDGAANDNKEQVQLRWGDTNYLKLFDIKIIAGRNVGQSDTVKEFLINETYARSLGFKRPEDALGKMLEFNKMRMPIVGVMHDFKTQSFHTAVGPLVFSSMDNRSFFFHVLLSPQNTSSWSGAIDKIKKAYNDIYPGKDFSFKFFDDTIAKFYETEKRTAGLLSWATGLSVLISCLGLLGLVMYTIQTRTKEIGIRKILGATVTNIISILSVEFIALVAIAFLVAAPLAWWATDKWLQGFAYRTEMSWWVFITAGIFMIAVAMATLSIQAIKAALTNPVKSLRTE